MVRRMRPSARVLSIAALACAACGGDPDTDGPEPPEFTMVAVTFNTGTTEGLRHDDPPDDGYDGADAMRSDTWYGDGLAWLPAVEATRAWLAEVQPDVIAFQEIFYAGECEAIPPEEHAEFFCETWSPGDPTVAQVILGGGYQVACNLQKPDKCLAVKRSFGTFRGCDGDLCLDGLDGARVPDCGSGSRVGRGVVDLVGGGSLTVVNVHGSSGVTVDDIACRVRQFEQVFVDLGDGMPAASGAVNVVMGDLNTDPGRLADGDESAARFVDFVGEGERFHFVSDVGRRAEPSYAGLFNIDHVVSDGLDGSCWIAGVTEGHPGVTEAVYFDHRPVVCSLGGDRP